MYDHGLLFRYAELSGRNANLGQHLRLLMGRKGQWVHCFRTVTSHTNNIVEAAFRVLKQTVLGRTRAFNVAHLLEFVCVHMEANYMARFTMAANATLICKMPQAPMGMREDSPHKILIEFMLYHLYVVSRPIRASIFACDGYSVMLHYLASRLA